MVSLRIIDREEHVPFSRDGGEFEEGEGEANLDLDFYLSEKQDSKADEGESSINLRSAVDEVKCGEPTRQLPALHQLRKIYSFEDNHINAELVPVLVDCLEREDSTELQYEAARMLRYLARVEIAVLIENDTMPLFSNLLNSPSEEVQEQGLRAIAIIADHAFHSRDFEAIPDDIVFNLLPFFYCPKAPFKLFWFALKALVYIIRCKPEDTVIALTPLKELLETGEDPEVLRLACEAVLYFSEEGESIEFIIGNNICPHLVELLFHDSPHILLPVMETMANIAEYGNYKEVINEKVLLRIVAIVSSGDMRELNTVRQIHMEICKFVFNITTLTQDEIELTINTGVISVLVGLLAEAPNAIKEEAAHAIVSGIVGGSDEQVEYFVDLDCVNHLTNLITPGNKVLTNTCLKGLFRMLKLTKQENTGKYQNLFPTAKFRDVIKTQADSTLSSYEHYSSVFPPAKKPRTSLSLDPRE